MKPGKKIEKKLQSRINGYNTACREAERRRAGSSKGYTCPGSRNPRKS
jgi:hypothetical protein